MGVKSAKGPGTALQLLKSFLVATCAVAVLTAGDPFSPARYRAGALPAMPVQAVGGGHVFLELTVSDAGTVDVVTPLRTTPPFTEALVDVARRWQFVPAEETVDGTSPPRRVPSQVLVAGVFRPPALLNAPALGEPPKDVASASAGTPFPTGLIVPAFPPRALFGGLVLVEVRVDPLGAVSGATVLRSAPPFDEPARDAARRWRFRPARLHGRAVATIAYLVFGFRQPVLSSSNSPEQTRRL